MFFEISKIFGFFAQPLNFSIFVLGLCVLAALLGWHRLSFAGMAMVFVVMALSGWTSLGARLLTPLEDRFPRPMAAPERVDGIVVLGGGLEGAINLARGGYELNSGGDRFVEAAILARRYPDARIDVSRGTATQNQAGAGEAATAPRLMTALGVEPDRLILENRSRNTYENAVFTRELVTPKPGETWLLVTSAFHMPRSVALFRKADFPIVPWPVDYRTSGNEGYGFFRDNPQDAMQNTAVAIREWIGLVAYYLSGRTGEVFPAPSANQS
ncbi:MAG: YdcF family protein [Rhizobiaceae bacterium]|nr:YdcF family protein [Rhizobiaceae bacterium]